MQPLFCIQAHAVGRVREHLRLIFVTITITIMTVVVIVTITITTSIGLPRAWSAFSISPSISLSSSWCNPYDLMFINTNMTSTVIQLPSLLQTSISKLQVIPIQSGGRSHHRVCIHKFIHLIFMHLSLHT